MLVLAIVLTSAVSLRSWNKEKLITAYTDNHDEIMAAAHASETLEKKPKSKKPKVRLQRALHFVLPLRLPLFNSYLNSRTTTRNVSLESQWEALLLRRRLTGNWHRQPRDCISN